MSSKGPAACAAALFALMWAPVAAHEIARAGPIQIAVGWGDEPAFSSARNSVEVVLTDPKGAPLRIESGSLSVEVSFGDERVTRAGAGRRWARQVPNQDLGQVGRERRGLRQQARLARGHRYC